MAKDKRHHFLVVFLSGSFGLLIALSLIPTGVKPNLLGSPGSYLSYFLYYSFGLCAWILPAVLCRFAFSRYKDDPLNKTGLKLLGLFLGVISVCVLIRILFPGKQIREGVELSGKLGIQVGDWLEAALTLFGTITICLMVLVLSTWLLEKEGHLVTVAKGVMEGFARGFAFLRENGFKALVLLANKTRQAFADWKARREAKKVAAEAHRKLDTGLNADDRIGKGIPTPPPKATIIASVPKTGKIFPPEKFSKEPKGRSLFTGEAEPDMEVNVPSGEDEDMVAAALAEAKVQNPMTLRQKMEAASIEMADEEEEDEEEEPRKTVRVIRQWKLPEVHILKTADEAKDRVVDDYEAVSHTIVETLKNFGVEAKVVGVNPGPTVTQYEVQPAAGVKITSISSLADDLALALQCGHLRIVAPIPGKAAVGVEVPNSKGRIVTLKELIVQEEFLTSTKKLRVALGKDIAGTACFDSIKDMPHILIAGSTGSGKSVCVNTIIASLLFKYTPEELRLVMVDPKRVEMAIYKGLPHLALPVVNDSKQANAALKWLVQEMENRYQILAHAGARDIDTFNSKVAQKREAGEADQYPLYYIVVLVDELADLIMAAKDQVEDSITRLAQMARAVGIHLVLATQRPSVEVITGIIKANFPSRIAFQVFSKVDSRTILDMNGAEALLGRGDMLYLASGSPKPLRLQGAYVTLEEIERLTDYWKSQGAPIYLADLETSKSRDMVTEESEDELFDEALEIVIRAKQASTSLLQRRLKVGYSRAARLLDDMEVRGLVGPADGNKPRKILAPNTDDSNGEFEEETLDEKLD